MATSRKRKFNRVDFLSDHVTALKEAIHTDIIVKPCGNGPGIPAHKAVLALKSKVLRNVLEDCELPPRESITIPDLTYEELGSMLEFFYIRILTTNKNFIEGLYLAADKYDIQYLQDMCREVLISALNVDNVLEILNLSSILSDTVLKKTAIDFVVTKIDLIFSKKFGIFAFDNPSLHLEITRALFKKVQPYLVYWDDCHAKGQY